jgi:hypothetical protein
MIPAERMGELLNRRPFRPLRLFLSDGTKHEIPHPEFAWAFGGRLFLGVPAKGNALSDGRVKEIALLHLTTVEEMVPRKSRRQEH